MAEQTVTTDATGAIDSVRGGETGRSSITGAHLNEWLRYLKIDVAHHVFAGLNSSSPADDFHHQSLVRTKLASDGATNDLFGLELGAGRMTGGV